jgi:hypothetical protein
MNQQIICAWSNVFVPRLNIHKPWWSDNFLQQNPECREFADPYVEHDSLTLLIDLILLKRGVYRHLLYNRGAKPNKAASKLSSETFKPAEGSQEGKDDGQV